MITPHKPPFKLREIKIEVTHKCPLTCIHCSSDSSPINIKEMTEEDCLRIIKEASVMGVEEVTFSGGEPLIWPFIEKSIKVARDRGLKVFIYTSGNVENVNEILARLKIFGIERFIFSIFGSNKRSHELVTRNSGSFENTLKAVEIANKLEITTEFHFVPFSSNYNELKEIANLSKEMGASRISVLRFVPQGRGRLIKEHDLSRLQNTELKNIIEKLRYEGFKIRTGSPYNFLMLNEQPACNSGIDRLIIGPDLRIYPCDAFKQVKAEEIIGIKRYSILKENSLEECWEKSKFLNIIRDYLTTDFENPCKSCNALELCLSGCLA